MSWIIYALLAPAIDTVTNFVDKYLIGDRIRDSHVITLYMAIVGVIAGTLVWIFNGFAFLGPRDTVLVLIAGILMYYWISFYFKALEEEETSVVILLFQLSPVITLVFSWLFLQETITFSQFLGFVLILSASTAVSLKETEGGGLYIGKAFWYVNISNLLWSIAAVLLKFTINTDGLLTVIAYESWGVALGGALSLVLFRHIRESFIDHVKRLRKGTASAVVGNEILSLIAKWVTFLAFSLGPVALVDVIAGVQVFYGIALGWVLTLLFPAVFREDTSRKRIILKITAAATLFYGIYLLA